MNMKNALILHGTDGNSEKNWFPWLKAKLEERAYKVWVPDLPQADQPNINRYNDFILSSDWNTIVIGHSSGAVEILGLLGKLPENAVINTAVLVGSFKDNIGNKKLNGLFEEPFDFEKIKMHAKRFIFIHSDNDPYCPLEHAEYLSNKLNGELIIKPGQKHFSIGTGGPEYKEFPFLLEVLGINK